MFENLSEEVAELFAEQQESHAKDLVRDVIFPRDREGDYIPTRFRVFVPNPPKTPERKKYMADYARKKWEQDIEARLRAGERPKSQPGKRGRPPTVWYKVAARLGIDLLAPVPARA